MCPQNAPEIRPNDAEQRFLTLAYNRFYDLFEETISDDFWERDAWYRLSKLKEVFTVYAELLNYEPIKWEIERLKNARPPMEAEISSELFKFIRNILSHFPFFNGWDEISLDRQAINWNKNSQSIDLFLQKYEGHNQVKYRFWEAEKKKMTYLSINFPVNYLKGDKFFLKDILSEKEGVKFAAILMRKVLNTQVEEIGK